MPISRLRRKRVFTPPAERPKVQVGSPRWLVPLMLAFFIIGLIWIVTFYLSSGAYPIETWGNFNLLAGFAFIIVGFGLSTRWR